MKKETKSVMGAPRKFPKGTVRVNLHIEPSQSDRINEALSRSGERCTISDFIRQAIDQRLAYEKKKF